MKPLSIDDRRHVEAAKGWCELHSFQDADAELEQVTPENRDHPDVLEARWQVCANLDKWEEALDLANAIARKRPGGPEGYIYTASSLREMDRFEEAFLVLLQAVERFPDDEMILYDLACICCCLERPEDARNWLSRAVDVGGDELMKRALTDPDLELICAAE